MTTGKRAEVVPNRNGAVTSAVLVHLRVEPAHFDWRWRERPALALLAWEALPRDPLARLRRIQVESTGTTINFRPAAITHRDIGLHFVSDSQEPFATLWFGSCKAREMAPAGLCCCVETNQTEAGCADQKADPAMTQRNEPVPPPYPAERARGGEIVLRTPLRRAIFIGGLAGAVVLGLLLAFAH
jgi:hypothetical protein